MIRGDRGAREEKVLTPRAYLLRAISLARNELPLLIVGFSCLGVTSAAGLLIPHYQVGWGERRGEAGALHSGE